MVSRRAAFAPCIDDHSHFRLHRLVECSVMAAAGHPNRHLAACRSRADEIREHRSAHRAAFADGSLSDHDHSNFDHIFLHAEAVHRGDRHQRAEGIKTACKFHKQSLTGGDEQLSTCASRKKRQY